MKCALFNTVKFYIFLVLVKVDKNVDKCSLSLIFNITNKKTKQNKKKLINKCFYEYNTVHTAELAGFNNGSTW